MKKKLVMTILSVVLNLALFSALAYCNKLNSHTEGLQAPFFLLQHLPDIGSSQGDSHQMALASTVK